MLGCVGGLPVGCKQFQEDHIVYSLFVVYLSQGKWKVLDYAGRLPLELSTTE